MSQEEKDRSHERIVVSAAAMVRQRGVDGTSVNDVMLDAGLTHGGFYKHFDSKEAMLDAALSRAFDEIAGLLRPDGPADQAGRSNHDFKRFYLSTKHLSTPERGCPVASLGADVGRASAALKTTFGLGIRRIVLLLARGTAGSREARRARGIRQLAMMAGAVMMARASDPATAREVLAACRDGPG